jgi:outer membrane protein assembly factor BamB
MPSAAASGWTTYHRDPARTGVDPTGPVLGSPRIAWRSDDLDGNVYAQPLYAESELILATENDSVYALDAVTGKLRWSRHLGQPMLGSQLPCGNINPSGITGTPVIDPRRRLLFIVAFMQPGRHVLFALDLPSGAVRLQRPVDAPGADPLAHQQRAALALIGDMVYVAFGGLYGDCADYRGTIVASRSDGSDGLDVYRVPTSREGAIWAPPGMAVDAQGDIFISTGNSAADDTFDFGNAVIRLSPNLRLIDWFAPRDWRQLSQRDADLGSLAPALLPGSLVFAIGKGGVGYLLAADHLGGIGGELFSRRVCASAYGGTASKPPLLFVPCSDGLYALRVTGRTFSTAWRAPLESAGPPIVAGGAVWAFDTGSGTLFALDPQSGAERWRRQLGDVTRFTSAAAAGNTVYAATQRNAFAITW